MDAAKTKHSVVAGEKLLLIKEAAAVKAQMDTLTNNAAIAKDAAISKLVATHAVELCKKFQEGAQFAQGLMQK